MEALNQRLFVKTKRDLDKGQAVEWRTYKMNRGLTIYPRGEGYEVREDGYHDHVFYARDWLAARKLLKTVIRREFPRSHRVRYRSFSP